MRSRQNIALQFLFAITIELSVDLNSRSRIKKTSGFLKKSKGFLFAFFHPLFNFTELSDSFCHRQPRADQRFQNQSFIWLILRYRSFFWMVYRERYRTG